MLQKVSKITGVKLTIDIYWYQSFNKVYKFLLAYTFSQGQFDHRYYDQTTFELQSTWNQAGKGCILFI